MPRIYEVPTHLNVEDALLLGLSARQLVRLAAFTSLAYGLWDQVTAIPPEPRALAAGLLALIGALVALVQPGGRPLDQWAFAGLAYALAPRRFTWRQPEPEIAAWRLLDGTGWVEFAPALVLQFPFVSRHSASRLGGRAGGGSGDVRYDSRQMGKPEGELQY